MKRRAVAGSLAVLHSLVVLGPALVVAGAARKGGLAWAHGIDLVLTSGVIAAVHGVLVWRRMRRGIRAHVVDAAVASLNALVVLALVTTALLFVLLGGLAPEHAAVLNKGWPILATWIGLHVLAVSTAGAVSRGLRSWLRRAHPPARAGGPGRDQLRTNP